MYEGQRVARTILEHMGSVIENLSYERTAGKSSVLSPSVLQRRWQMWSAAAYRQPRDETAEMGGTSSPPSSSLTLMTFMGSC